MRQRMLVAAVLLAAPAVASASNYAGLGLVAMVLLSPLGLVAAGVTWPFLSERMKRGSPFARLRKWLALAAAYDLVLLIACAKACGFDDLP